MQTSPTTTKVFPYMYIANRTTLNTTKTTPSTLTTTHKIAGTLQARHSFEALHNARLLASMRGADARFISLIRL